MIFPIGDDQVKGGPWPLFSYGFILLNVLVFFYFQLPNTAFTYGYSMVPYEIIHQIDLVGEVHGIPLTKSPNPIWLTFFTSIFMHGDWMHLLGNMVFLWVFADNIESTIGNFRFLIFYIIGGIIASFTHIYFNWNSIIPTLGASGAIAACLGAYLVMFPKSNIQMLIFIKVIRIPAFVFLLFWIIQQLVSGYGSLQSTDGGGVAWFAHIGGFIFGLLGGMYFRWVYPKMLHIGVEYCPQKRKSYRYNNRIITSKLKSWN
ncbi:MAG: rhomboid family intramembrane serine protease [Flavobacterium sp.]